MGTNYYVKSKPPCPLCNHVENDLHIGMSSGGWVFSLHVYPERGLITFQDWIKFLCDFDIIDEYGEYLSLEDMMKVITERSHSEGLLRSKVGEDRCVGNGAGTWDLIQGDFS